MSSKYRVRVADENDSSQIARVHNEAFGNLIKSYGIRFGYSILSEQDVIHWIEDQSYEESRVFVIESSEIVGYTHCILEIERGNQNIPVMYFHSTDWEFGQARIGVLPDVRRQSLGSNLVRSALNFEWSTSPLFAIAFVFQDNVDGDYLFRNLSFQKHDLFICKEYSETKPLANSSVIAKFDLSNSIPIYEPSVKIEIRRAEERDAQAVADLGRANVWWNPETWTTQWSSRFIRGEYSHIVYVAEYEGNVVGVMNYKQNTGEIGFTGVHPDYQRKGIGTYFMTQLLREMKDVGITEAIASSGMTQVDAIKLYHRLGFDIQKQDAFVLQLVDDH